MHTVVTTKSGDAEVVALLVSRARAAMNQVAGYDQARIDDAVTALAWAIYKPGDAQSLAELAVRGAGLGNVRSKVVKNTRKTFGTLREYAARSEPSAALCRKMPPGVRSFTPSRSAWWARSARRPIRPRPREQGDDGAEGRQCRHHRAVAGRQRDHGANRGADAGELERAAIPPTSCRSCRRRSARR